MCPASAAAALRKPQGASTARGSAPTTPRWLRGRPLTNVGYFFLDRSSTACLVPFFYLGLSSRKMLGTRPHRKKVPNTRNEGLACPSRAKNRAPHRPSRRGARSGDLGLSPRTFAQPYASCASTFSSSFSSRGIGRAIWKIMPASSTNATTVHAPKFPSTKNSQSWLMMRPTHQAKTH